MAAKWNDKHKEKFIKAVAVRWAANFESYKRRVHPADPEDGVYDQHCLSCLVFIQKVPDDREPGTPPVPEYCKKCKPAIDQGYVVRLKRFEVVVLPR